MTLRYVTGDATAPIGTGPRIIVHCVNDVGAWGAGFVLALSRRWPWPEREYLDWIHRPGIRLGSVQFVHVEPLLDVANLVGQSGVGSRNGVPPVRYDTIRIGLEQVRYHAQRYQCTVHAPRFGAGLAGGDWSRIEAIVTRELVDHGVDVTIYDLPT